MASLLSRQLNAKSLLSLPPQIRVTTYQNARTLSSTRPKQFDPISLLVSAPSALLDTFHTTLGIPWHTALPLTAIFVRTTIVYYISIRPSRHRRQVQNHLSPLAHAHVTLEKPERGWKGPDGDARRLHAYVHRIRAYFRSMNRLGKSVGLGGYKPYFLFNFGVLITFSEAIRLKCGAREGLLKMMVNSFESLQGKFGDSIVKNGARNVCTPAPAISRDPAESMADKLMAARDANEANSLAAAAESRAMGSDSTTNTLSEPVTQLDPFREAYFDPTMTTEGLSVCPDLTIPDPSFILPAMLFTTMCASVLLRPAVARGLPGSMGAQNDVSTLAGKLAKPDPSKSGSASSATNTTSDDAIIDPGRKATLPLFTFERRLGLTLAFLFTFASVNMPAGVLLYIVASVGSGWVQQRWLDVKYPIRPGILPCRRPVRMKVRRTW